MGLPWLAPPSRNNVLLLPWQGNMRIADYKDLLPHMSSLSSSNGPSRRGRDLRRTLFVEAITIPVLAVLVSVVIFSVFLLALGKSPAAFLELIWIGGFSSWFSIQNALQRAAPLILTGLAFAIPARIGLTLLGAEGALVLGGFASAVVAIPMVLGAWPPLIVLPLMALVAMATGAVWIGIAGWLKQARGVNETISSLLLTYIAIALVNFMIEGPLRDPGSANKPSTMPLGGDYRVTEMFGSSLHWGLAAGLLLAVGLWVLMERTAFGFSARMTGGNIRAAQGQGLPVGRLYVTCCAIAGACAGLAGFFEVGAIHGQANASLAAGYGFTGILVAFLARQNPLAIVPVAILFGALDASGGLVQRRMDMPDATMLVLQGTIFLVLLVSNTFYGRLPFLDYNRKGLST
jgi:simple sugar transport system permease protein